METENELKKLSEKERKQLLDKVLAETIEKINDLEKSFARVSEVSVNTMGIVGYAREAFDILRDETVRIKDEEDSYYNYPN